MSQLKGFKHLNKRPHADNIFETRRVILLSPFARSWTEMVVRHCPSENREPKHTVEPQKGREYFLVVARDRGAGLTELHNKHQWKSHPRGLTSQSHPEVKRQTGWNFIPVGGYPPGKRVLSLWNSSPGSTTLSGSVLFISGSVCDLQRINTSKHMFPKPVLTSHLHLGFQGQRCYLWLST